MKDIFKEFLFQKHVLVNDSPIFYASSREQNTASFATIVALAKKFSIRIKDGADMISESMIDDAARYLGEYVPEPFYKGFPESVRELTSEQLLYDQLLHYTQTYGMGWFEEAGHSVVEEVYERIGFNEYSEPKDFIVYGEKEATGYLKDRIFELLEGNRPLNVDQIEVVKAAFQEFGNEILPPWIPCKDTVIRLLYDSKDIGLCKFLKLSDTIKLLQYIQFTKYGSENLKKLNLKNQDRKFLTKVIDWFEAADMAEETDTHYCDYLEAFAKRKIWCGLFHHLHYKNKLNYGLMGRFISDVRSNKNLSHYHYFEMYMREGKYQAAANYLRQFKGESALIRNLNYILSRCKNDKQVEEVLKCLV